MPTLIACLSVMAIREVVFPDYVGHVGAQILEHLLLQYCKWSNKCMYGMCLYVGYMMHNMQHCPVIDMYLCAEETTRKSRPNNLMNSTLTYPEMTKDDKIMLKIGQRWDYLHCLDVSHPELEKWLKEGCHPKYHIFKKLPRSHPVKRHPRDNEHHPLNPPEDITEWVWESPTRLVEEWHVEKYGDKFAFVRGGGGTSSNK